MTSLNAWARQDLATWRSRLQDLTDGSVPLLTDEPVRTAVVVTDAGARACAAHTHNAVSWKAFNSPERQASSSVRELRGAEEALVQLFPHAHDMVVVVAIDNVVAVAWLNGAAPPAENGDRDRHAAVVVMRRIARWQLRHCSAVVAVQVPREYTHLADSLADAETDAQARLIFANALRQYGDAAAASVSSRRAPGRA